MKSLFENYVFFKNQASSFILLAILYKIVYSKGAMLRTYWCSNYSHRRSESLKLKKSHGISFSFSVPFILIKIITI